MVTRVTWGRHCVFCCGWLPTNPQPGQAYCSELCERMDHSSGRFWAASQNQANAGKPRLVLLPLVKMTPMPAPKGGLLAGRAP